MVEIISTTTRSATDVNGIALPTSAGLAGAAGEAAGAAGEVGSDRCSGRFFWETFSRARSGPTATATRFGPTALAYDYGSYAPPYAHGGTSNIYGYAHSNRYARRAERSNQIAADVTQSCGGFAPGVTGFPIDRIRHVIQPTGEAVAALDELADASSKASNVLSASCPNEPPLTPLARLDAVETRLEAMRKAIQIVRPPLASLYNSLSDEQRQRLDAIATEDNRHGRATATADSSGADTLASLCGSQSESFTKLPLQRIEEVVKPTGPQQTALDQLNQASAKAADELRTSCPARTGGELTDNKARRDEQSVGCDGAGG